MNSFIETSLRNFCSTRSIFGDSSVYVKFEEKFVDSDEKQYGLSSGMIFGHIIFRTQQNEVKTSVPLVLKNMIPQPFCQYYLHVQYFNEIFFYTRALPFLQQFGNLEIMLPKFYDSYIHSSQSTTEIILIYEDLKTQGFRSAPRFSFLDLDHLTMMVRRLGQFHSYSYLAKSRNPQEFNALGIWFKYRYVEVIRSQPKFLNLFAQIGLKRLRKDPLYRGHIEKVEKVLENINTLMLQANTMKQEEPLSVLCHGDYLAGNVMFQYENGQPKDMKIIDMACCGLASPMMDLSLVLYLNADQQTRSQHWDHLINSYYDGLCQEFGGIGVPSKESILKELTVNAVQSYFVASYFLPSLIEMDRGVISSYFDYIPAEFANNPSSEVPENVLKDSINKWCNEEDVRAEALADILRDLIDRKFI